ncbi:MAG: hypothetical protein QFF03_06385 [Pseudomonadota bacterium]|nr:hypothetical protein [Pseudomonadota bacterium]
MTTATYHTPSAQSLRHALHAIGAAARAFAEALFAAQGRQFVAQEARTSQRAAGADKARGRRQLFALAQQYQDLAPSLAAELRCIAARD